MKFDDLQRQIIMDHFKRPHNKSDIVLENYQQKRGLNPSCGDDVTIYILVENEQVIDVKWNGSGCSICCASASIMTSEFIGLTISEISEKYNQFKQMVSGNDYHEEMFEDAICFSGVKDFPARFKCAIISWDTAYSLLKGE